MNKDCNNEEWSKRANQIMCGHKQKRKKKKTLFLFTFQESFDLIKFMI